MGFVKGSANRSSRIRWARNWFTAGMAATCSVGMLALLGVSDPSGATSWSGTTLLVGTFHGHKGQYKTIQTAVNAAKPGDWILVAPGDYHPKADMHGTVTATRASRGDFGGVLIHKKNLRVIGMNRNSVIVDGTKAGSAKACSSTAKDQTLGPIGANGKALGRNGIDVYKADTVWVENLTVCNFLGGAGSAGNGVWWDGGAESAKIGLKGYWGNYLTATSTYYGPVTVDATYGIFANSAAGKAGWNQIYASNFNDSGMYVGACQQLCGITINHAWMEYNALGYSGTNSGGALVIENSKFDNNEDGFDTNTQIAGDPPPPQNGDCPGHKKSPITHTRSCWVLMHNTLETNNNPNVPEAPGYAAAGPVGTGMTLSGGINDTVMDNTFKTNGAWGILVVPFPDGSKPTPGNTCKASGGVQTTTLGLGCVYDPENDAIQHNTFAHNGFFGNPSNSDFGRITLNGNQPTNCFIGNKYPDGSAPATLEQATSKCGVTSKGTETGGPLLTQVLCDSGLLKTACPAGAKYPRATGHVTMKPLPKNLPSMPNPCTGAPSNAWCPGGKPI